MTEVVAMEQRAPNLAALPQTATDVVERGDVLYLTNDAFTMNNREHLFLDAAIVKQPRRHSGRARIIYLPAAQRLLKTTLKGSDREELMAMMKRFSGWAQQLVADLFPSYLP